MPAADRRALFARCRVAAEPGFTPTLLTFGAMILIGFGMLICARLPPWATGLPLLLCFGVHSAVIARRMRALIDRDLRARGLCTACGYDLRATPDPTGPRLPVCPECGTKAGHPPEPSAAS